MYYKLGLCTMGNWFQTTLISRYSIKGYDIDMGKKHQLYIYTSLHEKSVPFSIIQVSI